MCGGAGKLGQLLARFLADADAGLAALGDQPCQPGVIAFVRHQHVVKTAASGLESLLHRMQSVQHFHES